MRKVSGSRPDGVQGKKRRRKRGKNRARERIGEKTARGSAQSNPLLFVR